MASGTSKALDNFQTSPLKLFIQDIYRANHTENKYIYEFLGLQFKNVMLHGVVTSVYNTTDKTTNLELSDPTGSIQCYYDSTKSNSTPKTDILNNLNYHFAAASRFGDENIDTMSMLMQKIKTKRLNIPEGSYLSVVGDIFLDSKGNRMISVYECVVTSIERDIVWLEELRYLYDKFYLCVKEEKSND